MEQETLFTSSKWDILKCLEKGDKSPLDLAKETNTSIANISQQLRLLELAGFVKSQRVPNREKGLPRINYSLTQNFSYFVISSPKFVEKKFLKVQDYQKSIMKIWFIENQTLHYYLEKFFWTLDLSKINFLSVDYTDSKNIVAYIISEDASLKKLKDLTIDGEYGTKNFKIVHIKTPEEDKNALVLYEKTHSK